MSSSTGRAEATDNARVFCFIDEGGFGQLLTKWTVGGTLAAPALRVQLACGVTLPAEEHRWWRYSREKNSERTGWKLMWPQHLLSQLSRQVPLSCRVRIIMASNQNSEA